MKPMREENHNLRSETAQRRFVTRRHTKNWQLRAFVVLEPQKQEKKFSMKTDEQIAGECCWCGLALSETVYGLGSSYSEFSPSNDTFQQVVLPKSDRSIHGAVLREGSRAFNEGYHLIFATCSASCAQGLNEALAREEVRFKKRATMNTDA